jgi:molecular chaperone GrpE
MSDSTTSEQDLAGGDRPSDPVPLGTLPREGEAPPAAPAATADDVPPEAVATADPVPAEPAAGPAEPVPEEEQMSAEELELSEMEARLLDDMDRLQSERNDYLDQLLRTRADFENYRKRIQKQQSEYTERAAEALVAKLLDVLDTFELAEAHGQGYEQVHDRLVAILAKEGLDRIDPAGEQFDPNEADAVAHEDGDGGPVVAEVLRPGYRWKGRVLRPAMVKVKG